LIRNLQQETGLSVLLITHDLGVVAEVADHVAVMYAGHIVENASVQELFARPLHPYTQGLFASLPARSRRGHDLTTLEGRVPSPANWPPGCRFEPRCRYRWETCARVPPVFRPAEAAHPVRCHLYDPGTDRPMKGTPSAEQEKAHEIVEGGIDS